MSQNTREAIRWRSETGHVLLVAPALTAELVVTVGLEQSSRDRAGFLDAWDRNTGKQRWSFSGSAGMGLRGGILGTPAVAGDLICFASGRGTLVCLDWRSGLKKWERSISGSVVTAPAIMNDQVFFASEDGSLNSLELMTGKLRWTFKTGNAIRATPVINDGHVIVGSWDGNLYAVTSEGTLLWKAELSPARPGAVAAGPQGVVFFDTATGDLRSITVVSDASAWQINEVWRIPTGNRTGVQPVLAQGMVCFVGKGERHVTCVDAANGVQQWTITMANAPLTPVVKGGQLVVASRNGQIATFDLKAGVEIWRTETGIPFSSDPKIWEGVFYVGGSDGAVYALGVN